MQRNVTIESIRRIAAEIGHRNFVVKARNLPIVANVASESTRFAAMQIAMQLEDNGIWIGEGTVGALMRI